MQNFNKIKKIVHTIFLSKTERLNDVFEKCLNRFRVVNKGWIIKVYDEDDAQEIISKYFPQILPIYNSYPHYVQKADLFRVLLVYIFGGFYMDMDMYCLKRLDELLHYDLIIPEERSVSGEKKEILSKLDGITIKNNLRLGNYMFGAIPLHPFFLFYFKEAIKVASKEIRHEGDILETTGPALLTKVYHKYGKIFPEITLLRNLDRQCVMPFHNEISCHFGNFASHLHQGTWRWQHKDGNQVFKNSMGDSLLHAGMKGIVQKINQIKPNKIYLAKPAQSINLSLYNKYLYRYLKQSASLLLRKDDLVNSKILVLEISTLEEIKLNKKNEYFLIISEPVKLMPISIRETINKFVKVCIVFDKQTKEALQHNDIEVIIKIETIFYLPLFRDFSEDSEIKRNFIVGIYSDLKHEQQKKINELNYALRRINNLKLKVFFNDKEGKELDEGIGLINIKNERLSHELNSLNIFISVNGVQCSVQEIALLQSVLYLGIPCVTNTELKEIHKALLKFLSLENFNNNNPADIVSAIQNVKTEYLKYNKRSLRAAKFIEDKLSIEKVAHNIIKTVLQ